KLSVVVLIFMFACNKQKGDVNEILKTDKEFSAMCMDKGMSTAFMAYAADDVIKMRPQEYPIMNKQDLKKMFDEHKSDGNLKFKWEPVKGDISASGDLGYTFGNWQIYIKGGPTSKDTTIYGNYISIWKKQADGSWKYVLDGGNVTPAPENGE
ncbi:MAG: YybH family protein, partial [Bacteroidia bacterium]